MRLLVVEDDNNFGQSLISALRKYYAVDWAKTAKEGRNLFGENEYDLVILDLGLPDLPGVELCKKIRLLNLNVPILILSGEFNKAADKVTGLDFGADDYLTKPVDMPELFARVRALLRRSPSNIPFGLLKADSLVLDTAQRTVTVGQKSVVLRRKEFDLLEYLLRNKNNVVTRGMILEHVWDGRVDLFTNAIDVHIKYLRDKIDRPFQRSTIKTVHGLGYKLVEGKGGESNGKSYRADINRQKQSQPIGH